MKGEKKRGGEGGGRKERDNELQILTRCHHLKTKKERTDNTTHSQTHPGLCPGAPETRRSQSALHG